MANSLNIGAWINHSANLVTDAVKTVNTRSPNLTLKEQAKIDPMVRDNLENYRDSKAPRARVRAEEFSAKYVAWVATNASKADTDGNGKLSLAQIMTLPEDLIAEALDFAGIQDPRTAEAPVAEIAQRVTDTIKERQSRTTNLRLNLNDIRAIVKAAAGDDGAIGPNAKEVLADFYFGQKQLVPSAQKNAAASSYLSDLLPFGSSVDLMVKPLRIEEFEGIRDAKNAIMAAAESRPGSDPLNVFSGDTGTRAGVDPVETDGDANTARDTPPIGYLEVAYDEQGYHLTGEIVALDPSAYPTDRLAAAIGKLGQNDPDVAYTRFSLDTREPATDGELQYFYRDDFDL